MRILDIVQPHLPDHICDWKIVGPDTMEDEFAVTVMYKRRKSDPWSWLRITPSPTTMVEKVVRTVKCSRKK